MIGGIFTSFLLELLVYPPIYQFWKWHAEVKRRCVSNPPVGTESVSSTVELIHTDHR
jgi:hypothetical protein